MIELISKRMAQVIHSHYPESDIEITAYELGHKINFWSIIILTFLLSFTFGNWYASIISMISFALLRLWSGGKHFSLTTCTIICTTVFVLAPIIPMTPFLAVIAYVIIIPAFLFNTSIKSRIHCWLFILFSLICVSPIFYLPLLLQAALLPWKEDSHEKMG